MTASDPAAWLLLVAAVHAGFQVTVDLVVYPALADVPEEQWDAAHEAHSRRITPLVAALYPALLGLVVWAVVTCPGAPGAWLALGGAVVTCAVTACVAAPMHGRMARAPVDARPGLLVRLQRVDRVRTVGALSALAGALLL